MVELLPRLWALVVPMAITLPKVGRYLALLKRTFQHHVSSIGTRKTKVRKRGEGKQAESLRYETTAESLDHFSLYNTLAASSKLVRLIARICTIERHGVYVSCLSRLTFPSRPEREAVGRQGSHQGACLRPSAA